MIYKQFIQKVLFIVIGIVFSYATLSSVVYAETDTGLPDPAIIRQQVNEDLEASKQTNTSANTSSDSQQTPKAQTPPTQQPKASAAPRSGSQTGQTYTYTPLLADFPQPDVTGGTNDFAGFFNYIFKLVIGLTGVLAVLMIIIGGIQYVSTDSWNGKDLGKKRIQAALGGLILALSSFLILNSIDPSLTYLNFAKGLQPVTTSGGADLIPTLGEREWN